MALRVIGGEFRGRLLKSSRGRGTRPLRSQVREAMFDVLGDRVAGKSVWDLFAGTGATGIEALSRGASWVTFVEKNNAALTTLKDNLEIVGYNEDGEPDALERVEVLKADAWEPAISSAEASPPGVIFLDPPYQAVAEDPVQAACRAARLADLLDPSGVLCFHFEEGVLDLDDFDSDLEVDLRRWGRSAVALIEGRDSSVDQECSTADSLI